MNRTITKIEALQELPKRTRVAAYARVSSGKEAMLNSLAAQVNYYKQFIQNNSRRLIYVRCQKHTCISKLKF